MANLWGNYLLTYAATATEALAQGVGAQFDGTVSGAGEYGYPVPQDFAIGDVSTLVTVGETLVLSGAAFAAGVDLELDANGKFIAQSSGIKVARSYKAATAADQLIEAIVIAN